MFKGNTTHPQSARANTAFHASLLTAAVAGALGLSLSASAVAAATVQTGGTLESGWTYYNVAHGGFETDPSDGYINSYAQVQAWEDAAPESLVIQNKFTGSDLSVIQATGPNFTDFSHVIAGQDRWTTISGLMIGSEDSVVLPSGTVDNLSVSVSASDITDPEAFFDFTGVTHVSGVVEFGGSAANIDVLSSLSDAGKEDVGPATIGFHLEGDSGTKATFSAEKVAISAEATGTHAAASALYLVGDRGATAIDFTGSTVELKASSEKDSAMGMFLDAPDGHVPDEDGTGTISFSSNTALNIESTGVGAVGAVASIGTINVGGRADITATAQKEAYGVLGLTYGDITFNGETTISAAATDGAATAVRLDEKFESHDGLFQHLVVGFEPDDLAAKESVTFNGKTTLTASGNEATGIRTNTGTATFNDDLAISLSGEDVQGVDIWYGSSVKIAGDLNITAENFSYANGILLDEGSITVQGATTINLSGMDQTGINADGIFNAEFDDVTINASGNDIHGIYVWSSEPGSTFTVNGDLTINVRQSGEADSISSAIQLDENASLVVNGNTTVSASGNADALHVSMSGSKLSLLGEKSDINGRVYLGVGSVMELAGDVTINGDVDLSGKVLGDSALTINAQNGIVHEDAELSADSITFGSGDFKNYGEVNANSVTLNQGAVVSNLQGFHAPKMILNAGSRYVDWYDLDDEEDAAEFNSGIVSIDGDLLVFAGGEIGAMSKQDGQEMDITGIKLLPDPGSDAENDDSQVRFEAGEYTFDTFEVDAPVFEKGPRLQVTGGTLNLGKLTLTQGDAYLTGGTVNVNTLSVAGGTLVLGSSTGTALLNVSDKLANATTTDITVANNGTLTTNLDAVGFTQTESGYSLAEDVHAVAVEAGGTMRVEGFDGVKLSIADLAALKADLAGTNSDGLLEIVGNVEITDLAINNGEVTVDQVNDLGNITTDALQSATVTGVTDNGVTGSYKAVKLGEGVESLNVQNGALTLNGSAEGGHLVADSTGENAAGIVVTDQVATIGRADKGNKGTLESLTLEKDAMVNVVGTNEAVFSLGTVSTTEEATGSNTLNVLGAKAEATEIGGEVAVNVGSSDVAGHVDVAKLTTSGLIFLDPAWKGDDEISDGSFLTAEDVGADGKLNAQIVIGQNSTVAIGATKDEAVQAFADTELKYGQDGVTAVFYAKKAFALSDTGAIRVDGSITEAPDSVPAGSFTVAANGLFMADAQAAAEGPVVTAVTIKFDEGSHIRVVGLSDDNLTGTLMTATSTEEGAISIDQSVIDDAKDSGIYSLDLTTEGGKISYVATEVAAADAFPTFEGTAFLEALREVGLDEDSADRTHAFLSRLNYHNGMTAAEASDIGNQAMALAATSGVYNVALDASKLMNKSVDGRMSIANGLVRGEGAMVWADVLATTNEAKSLYGDSGYDVDLYGGVLGADVGLGNGKVIGAALTVGTGDGGSKGAAFDVDNDADFVGFSVYGSHRLGDFNGKVDIGWMHTTSDLSATAFGVKLDDEVTADVWTVGIGGEYLFNVGSINIVPHVGIRWTRLDVDGYTGAFKTDDDTMDIFTAPIGVAFSGNIDAGGWKLAPKVDLSIVPSFGDDDATSKVRWGNVKETIKTQVVDDAPFQASLGIDAQNGNWTIGAAYELGIGGDDRTDNMFKLKASYAF